MPRERGPRLDPVPVGFNAFLLGVRLAGAHIGCCSVSERETACSGTLYQAVRPRVILISPSNPGTPGRRNDAIDTSCNKLYTFGAALLSDFIHAE